MAQVTVFHDADVTVTVVEGTPPVDQTALVASLTAQVAALTAKLALVKADVDKAETDAA
jgi:hypothetical protein